MELMWRRPRRLYPLQPICRGHGPGWCIPTPIRIWQRSAPASYSLRFFRGTFRGRSGSWHSFAACIPEKRGVWPEARASMSNVLTSYFANKRSGPRGWQRGIGRRLPVRPAVIGCYQRHSMCHRFAAGRFATRMSCERPSCRLKKNRRRAWLHRKQASISTHWLWVHGRC